MLPHNLMIRFESSADYTAERLNRQEMQRLHSGIKKPQETLILLLEIF
jgi:hypothetical protein